jgi:hypothetical protein
MHSLFESFLRRIERRRFKRNIDRALALNLRGEVRSDGLISVDSRSCLEIAWQARDIHPWDQDLPQAERASLFVEQCLSDTDAAIGRLFERLRCVGLIELRVLDRSSEHTIISGSVLRHEYERLMVSSSGMRLKQMGLNYRLAGSRFESLESYTDHRAIPLDFARIINGRTDHDHSSPSENLH